MLRTSRAPSAPIEGGMANKKLVGWGCLARHKGGSRLAGLRDFSLRGGRHCLEMLGEISPVQARIYPLIIQEVAHDSVTSH